VRRSSETGKQANPLAIRLSCDRERNFSSEVPDPTLPRKASSEEAGARTANRHR
jgi:hypothetical protein